MKFTDDGQVECPQCAGIYLHLYRAEMLTVGYEGRPEAHLHFHCEAGCRVVFSLYNHEGPTYSRRVR